MDGSRKHIMTRLPDTDKVTLMTFAGKYKYLTGTGCILSGISAVIALVPYLCMWKVIKLAVLNWPGGLAGGTLVWGWIGGGFLAPEYAYLFWGSYVYPSFGLPDSQKYEDGCPSPPGRTAHWLFQGDRKRKAAPYH